MRTCAQIVACNREVGDANYMFTVRSEAILSVLKNSNGHLCTRKCCGDAVATVGGEPFLCSHVCFAHAREGIGVLVQD